MPPTTLPSRLEAPLRTPLARISLPRPQRRYRSQVRTATDLTLDTYQDCIDIYCADSPSAVAGPVAALLDAVVARIPRHGSVLEVGSGPGLEAQYLEERGLIVDRTDATPAFVDRMRQEGHSARLLDVREADLGGPYDAVVANAVLLHLERAHAERALASIRTDTRPGGVLALTLKEGDGEAWSEAKLGRPRWFVYWQEDPLRQVLQRVGWRVLELTHVQGRTERWLYVLCER